MWHRHSYLCQFFSLEAGSAKSSRCQAVIGIFLSQRNRETRKKTPKKERTVAAGNLAFDPPWPRLVNSREESYGIGVQQRRSSMIDVEAANNDAFHAHAMMCHGPAVAMGPLSGMAPLLKAHWCETCCMGRKQLDHLQVKGGNIIGLAARHQLPINGYCQVYPMRTGILEICP